MQAIGRLLMLLALCTRTLITARALPGDAVPPLAPPTDAIDAAGLGQAQYRQLRQTEALGEEGKERISFSCSARKDGTEASLQEQNTCLWRESESAIRKIGRLEREAERAKRENDILKREIERLRCGSLERNSVKMVRDPPRLPAPPPPPPPHQFPQRAPLIEEMFSFKSMAEDQRRRLSGTAATCTASTTTTDFSVSDETGLKNAVACANDNTNQPYFIGVEQDIQLTSRWRPGSSSLSHAMEIMSLTKLEIRSSKPGGALAEIRGIGKSYSASTGLSSGFNIFLVYLNAELKLTNLVLSNGYSYFGGAIYNRGTTTITGCILQDNSADTGGAIYSHYSGAIM